VIFGVNAIVNGDRASAAAWKSALDPFLLTHAAAHETEFVPFGVQRGIALPYDDLRGLDGLDAPGTQVPEHPDAHMYLQAAERLHTPPARTVVVETCPLGVAAAREGGFGAVVGVDRTGGSAALAERGADLVIADLCELPVHTRSAA
jgi:beta-phosphoglucomutase-like phosphatase (HAD superfamily)